MNGCAGGMPGVGNLEKVSPGFRDRGLVPCSHIGGKYFYRETDIQQILEEGLIKNRK